MLLSSLLLANSVLLVEPIFPRPALANVSVPALEESIPQGAQRVPLLNVRLTAACDEPLVVTGLTVAHQGVGSLQDFSRVYAVSGLKRLSRAATFPQRDPLYLRLSPLAIPPCSSQDIALLADISTSADAGGEHRFVLSAVEADGAVTITTDASTSKPAAITSHSEQSSVRAELVAPLGGVSYGSRQMVARISLEGSGTRDQHVVAITLHNRGSASNSDLQNFYLETANGVRVSEIVPSMDGRIVRIPLLSSFVLSGRDQKLLNVRADRRSSSRRTIRWELEEASDVEVQEVRTR